MMERVAERKDSVGGAKTLFIVLFIVLASGIGTVNGEECVARVKSLTGEWVKASEEQLHDRWGGCEPVVGCVGSKSLDSEAAVYGCSVCKKVGGGAGADAASCEDDCKRYQNPCRLGFERAGNVCGNELKVLSQKCVFKEESCQVITEEVSVLCKAEQQEPKNGIKIEAQCMTPYVVDKGYVCGGVAVSKEYEPDPSNTSLCRERSGGESPEVACR